MLQFCMNAIMQRSIDTRSGFASPVIGAASAGVEAASARAACRRTVAIAGDAMENASRLRRFIGVSSLLASKRAGSLQTWQANDGTSWGGIGASATPLHRAGRTRPRPANPASIEAGCGRTPRPGRIPSRPVLTIAAARSRRPGEGVVKWALGEDERVLLG